MSLFYIVPPPKPTQFKFPLRKKQISNWTSTIFTWKLFPRSYEKHLIFFLSAWNLFTWTNEKQVPFMTFLPVHLCARMSTRTALETKIQGSELRKNADVSWVIPVTILLTNFQSYGGSSDTVHCVATRKQNNSQPKSIVCKFVWRLAREQVIAMRPGCAINLKQESSLMNAGIFDHLTP